MAFLNLTTTDAIRAVLGIDSTDLPDQRMTDMMMEETLLVSLSGFDYATIIAEGEAAGATDTQIQNLSYLKLYSMYYLASTVSSVEVFGMQSETDGKNAYKRFSGTNWSGILRKIGSMASYYRGLLEDEVGTGTGTVSPTGLVGISSPDYDPVVGPNG